MAFFSASTRLTSVSISFSPSSRGIFTPSPNPNLTPNRVVVISKEVPLSHSPFSTGTLKWRIAATSICKQEPIGVALSLSSVKECFSDEELHAAVRLRIRTFYDFNESCGVEDYRKYLTEREYEALKERVAGKKIGFKRVSCINATLPSSTTLKSFAELCSSCKKIQFSNNGKDCVVVGTLDVNQCVRLADELTGKKPEGIGAELKRGYLSNVCVAKELQRNGFGHALISKSKKVARHWGITDLYVHVAVDNEAARKLYEKGGFIYENEEPAWQARFLTGFIRLALISSFPKLDTTFHLEHFILLNTFTYQVFILSKRFLEYQFTLGLFKVAHIAIDSLMNHKWIYFDYGFNIDVFSKIHGQLLNCLTSSQMKNFDAHILNIKIKKNFVGYLNIMIKSERILRSVGRLACETYLQTLKRGIQHDIFYGLSSQAYTYEGQTSSGSSFSISIQESLYSQQIAALTAELEQVRKAQADWQMQMQL
ncbi:hypothetical protein M5K25_024911 [Dendrobium thyrsiflorum]|uniref:N-acetyltransferase domain-containing protein n=1 Tax=Dendrobium thyrsiflorum TaxID=117978 RepID=A0ABD0U7N3_DENTH